MMNNIFSHFGDKSSAKKRILLVVTFIRGLKHYIYKNTVKQHKNKLENIRNTHPSPKSTVSL